MLLAATFFFFYKKKSYVDRSLPRGGGIASEPDLPNLEMDPQPLLLPKGRKSHPTARYTHNNKNNDALE